MLDIKYVEELYKALHPSLTGAHVGRFVIHHAEMMQQRDYFYLMLDERTLRTKLNLN